MNHIQKEQVFLTNLAKTRSIKRRRELLNQANTHQILLIVEICLNILKMRIPLKRAQIRRLKEYEGFIRRLARVRSEKSARNLLQVGSGFPLLGVLLKPVIGALIKATPGIVASLALSKS
jgi:hypothetical protein